MANNLKLVLTTSEMVADDEMDIVYYATQDDVVGYYGRSFLILRYEDGSELKFNNLLVVTEDDIVDKENLIYVKLPKKITKIEEGAFEDCSNLTKIEMYGNVTSIGNDAFRNCSSLESISFAVNLKEIGEGAFYNCEGLKEVIIGPEVTSIGMSAFANCTSVEKVVLNDKLDYVNYGAFSGCYSLTNVKFGENITTVYSSAFSSCSSLTSLNLNDNLTTISSSAFVGSSNIKEINGGNIQVVGSGAFSGCNSLTSIDLSNTNRVESGAFSGCPNLENVGSLSNVTYIGGGGFSGTNLHGDLNLDSIECLDGGSFSGCRNLDGTLTLGPNLTRINGGDFYSTNFTTVVIKSENTTITSSLMAGMSNLTYIKLEGDIKLGDYACSGLSSIEKVDFGNTTTIPQYAFLNCSNLSEINLSGVKDINSGAFIGCANLSDINFDGVEHIGSSAFSGCEGLTCLEIPPSITKIDSNAFSNCSNLKDIDYNASVLETGSFMGMYSCSGLTIGDNVTKINGTLGQGCMMGLENLTIGTGITQLDSYSLGYLSKLESVELKGDIIEVPAGCFYNDVALKEIVIPNTVTRIGSDAFQDCHAITSIILPEGLERIESSAFFQTSKLESLVIPNTVTYIGNSALATFSQNIKELIIPSSVQYLGDEYNHPFYGYYELDRLIYNASGVTWTSTMNYGMDSKYVEYGPGCKIADRNNGNNNFNNAETIYFHDDCEFLGGGVFERCSSLKSFRLPNTPFNLGSWSFYNCSELTRVEIPESCQNINGEGFFDSCGKLEYVNIPNNVNISNTNSMFRYCTSLTSITMPDSITTIGKLMFNNCYSLTSITIPKNVNLIVIDGYGSNSTSPFKGCSGLTEVIYDSAYIPLSPSTLGMICNDSDVERVVIGDNVTRIEDGTFSSRAKVANEVIVGKNLQYIGTNSFSCKGLRELDASNVTFIGNVPFSECGNLTKVTLSDKLQTLSPGSWSSCTSLSDIYVKADHEPVTFDFPGMFVIPCNGTLHVNKGATADDFSTWLATLNYDENYTWILVDDIE